MKLDETNFTGLEMELVNKGSLEKDGIADITENGISFTDDVIKKMKTVFDIDYPKTVAVEDCEKFSEKIAETLRGYKK